jgi:thymidine phosphorylase
VLLDVKVGDGRSWPTRRGRSLAELCVRIGEAHGRRTGALVTDMSQPLGDGVGNAIEIAVAIEVLRGDAMPSTSGSGSRCWCGPGTRSTRTPSP